MARVFRRVSLCPSHRHRGHRHGRCLSTHLVAGLRVGRMPFDTARMVVTVVYWKKACFSLEISPVNAFLLKTCAGSRHACPPTHERVSFAVVAGRGRSHRLVADVAGSIAGETFGAGLGGNVRATSRALPKAGSVSRSPPKAGLPLGRPTPLHGRNRVRRRRPSLARASATTRASRPGR